MFHWFPGCSDSPASPVANSRHRPANLVAAHRQDLKTKKEQVQRQAPTCVAFVCRVASRALPPHCKAGESTDQLTRSASTEWFTGRRYSASTAGMLIWSYPTSRCQHASQAGGEECVTDAIDGNSGSQDRHHWRDEARRCKSCD